MGARRQPVDQRRRGPAARLARGATDDQLAHVDHLRQAADERARRPASPTPCCSAWAAPCWAPRRWPAPSGRRAGLPGAARARFHRSRADPRGRARARPRPHAVHRVQQVGQHAGAEHPQAALLRGACRGVVGPAEVGRRFIAITDPELEDAVRRRGRPASGGSSSACRRWAAASPRSATSAWCPAAIMGLDIARLLGQADEMVHSCAASVPVEENPGACSASLHGRAGRAQGRDKVTLVVSPAIQALGAWVEQLLTASLGKTGRGLLVVEGEPLGTPASYGADRLFVYLRLEPAPDAAQDAAVAALEAAGHAGGAHHAGRSLRARRRVLPLAVRHGGGRGGARHQPVRSARHRGQPRSPPASSPTSSRRPARWRRRRRCARATGSALFADARQRRASSVAERTVAGGPRRPPAAAPGPATTSRCCAFLEMNAATEAELQALRGRSATGSSVATSLGLGAALSALHGQAYKGGAEHRRVPAADRRRRGRRAGARARSTRFGVVKAAQARGDLQVLGERGRRAVRVHLGRDVKAGLAALRKAVEQALR